MNASLWAGAIAAIVTGFASIVVALIQFRKENRKDHGAVMRKLDGIEGKVDGIGTKVDKHEGWHQGRGDFNPQIYTLPPTKFGSLNRTTDVSSLC